MTRVEVKICGVRDPGALDAAAKAEADWVGFVFFPPSPRHLTPAQAAALAARAPSWLGRVGLLVEPADADVAAVLGAVALDALQVYASAARVAELRARFGLPVWHAIGVSTAADLPAEARGVDRLVLEAQPPGDATRPGGNAARFDWSLLRDWTPPAPWLLAGGLTPENVAGAIRETGARAVDVSSGVETARGVKDAGLIQTFIAAARSGGSLDNPSPRSPPARGGGEGKAPSPCGRGLGEG
ncbi:MAG: phosphoribosylanthranilate isomerase [Acetobacteraceae bacterium]|nr:phosphoribosylanthranilate isomerase [Acetobacteraceae bacterium]